MIQIKAVDAENIWDVCGLASRQDSPGVEGAPCAGGTQTRRRPERQRRLATPACVYCAAAKLRHASKHNCRVASPPITLRAAPIFPKWRKKPHRRVRSRQRRNQMNFFYK